MLVHLNLSGRRLATLRRTMGLMIIAFWLGVTLLATQPASRGFAQGSTTILIHEPSSNVNVGDTVTVDIKIESVTDLYGVDVRLSFDPALLEVQDAEPGTTGVQIQKGAFPAPECVIKNEADNSAGTIWYAVSQMNPTEPVSGAGVVASITFKGLAEGTSSVDFTYHKLVERDGEPITPTTVYSGEITVNPVVDLELTKEVDNPSPTAGEQVMFTITVINKGPSDATGVKVEDVVWPGNLSWSSDDSGGDYDKDTRIWTVGDLDASGSATLHITATVNAEGSFENIAEVSACDQDDTDSTPNNYPPNIEDDTGTATGDAYPTAVTLSSFTARSSVDLKDSFVWPWLVGAATLAMSGVLWVRRWANGQ